MVLEKHTRIVSTCHKRVVNVLARRKRVSEADAENEAGSTNLGRAVDFTLKSLP